MSDDPEAFDRIWNARAWRALVAVPPIVASALLMLVLLGWAGRWEPLIMLVWATCGLLTLTRCGERCAVRLAGRFRRPSAEERAALDRIWSTVLNRCGIDPACMDLYVRPSGTMNAYATGRRSIAVTSTVLREHHAGHVDDQMLAGILGHEIGHHVTATERCALAVVWLSLPWRLASRLVLRLSMRLAGRQPRGALILLAVATVGVAIVQSAQQRKWSSVVILVALSVLTPLVPFADAALSRAGERAADRFAAIAGYGEPLTRALEVLAQEDLRRGSTTAILASHPRTERRIGDLAAGPDESRALGLDGLATSGGSVADRSG